MYGFIKKQIESDQFLVKYTNRPKQTIHGCDLLPNDILHNTQVVSRYEWWVGYVPIQTTIYGINKKGVPIQKVVTSDCKTFFVPIKKQYQDHYIVFRYNKYEKAKHYGTLERVIGSVHKDQESCMTEAIVNWKHDKHVSVHWIPDLTPDRVDIFDRTIVSVDPESCIDIDDAIHVHEENGLLEVGIHIADVTSFIEPNSDVDLEMCKRASSIYFDEKTCHMIPFFQEVSLKAGEVKRAFSCIVYIQDDQLVRYEFKKTRIRVSHNLTYDMFDTQHRMYDMGKTIGRLLHQDIHYYDSHKMVEMFMLLANYCSADFMAKQGYGIYRQHKKTDVVVPPEVSTELRKKIEQCQQNSAEYIVGSPESHETLSFDQYTHFTSPIRRYTDQMVHRLLYAYTRGEQCPYSEQELEKRITIQNRTTQYYRRLVYRMKILALAKHLHDCYYTHGFVIQIHQNKLRVYVSEWNIELNCTMYHRKMKDVVEQPDICVGDRVNLKLIPSPNTLEKLYVYLDDES